MKLITLTHALYKNGVIMILKSWGW